VGLERGPSRRREVNAARSTILAIRARPVQHGRARLSYGGGRKEADVNKAELVEEIAAKTKLGASDVARVIDALMDIVTRAVVRGEKVVLSGFGTFHRKARARRTARNIWADKPLRVPPRNVPAFRPGKPFRDAVSRRRRAAASSSRSAKSKR
jgi:DNA-binding protein HU-beta